MCFYRCFCCFCISCLQVTVEGEVGGSAVLPCSSIGNGLKNEDVTVYWRHNSSQNVYDIIEGKGSVEKQDPAYKNRAETFPNQYMKGNFSLKLNNLQYKDAGKYVCYITKAHKNPSTQLFLKTLCIAFIFCCSVATDLRVLSFSCRTLYVIVLN
uniref:Ig-like domain-containing protein n=1 Tax=Sinocyclocheilus anshuiensis TaxID=1608454 RepID=A0A671SE02_9TELE